MLRIVIATPDEAMTSWLHDAIAPVEQFEVVGTGHDPESALEVVGRTHPDVVVVDVDLGMSPQDGPTLIRSITDAVPATVVIVVAAAEALDGSAPAALAAGAAGVLAKDGSAQILAERWSELETDPDTPSHPRGHHLLGMG